MSAPWLKSLSLVLALALAALSCSGPPAAHPNQQCQFSECERLSPRHVLSLDGEWQSQKTKSDALQPPASGYQSAKVPGVAWSEARGQSEYTWLRRELALPENMRGQRVFLRLGGARFHPHVFVDGKLVAERMDGWTPFEVELTSELADGKKHVLDVRCQDWGATFDAGYRLPGSGEARSTPKGKVLAPVGGHLGFYGAWDHVELEGRGTAFAEDVVIVPSHRKGTLRVRGKVNALGRGAYRVTAIVLDDHGQVHGMPVVHVEAGQAFELETEFAEAERWSPDHPKLYELQLSVMRDGDSALRDVSEHTFGFKEVWTEGPDFYLNGVKRHLLASSTWPSAQPQSREEVRAALAKIKAANNIAFRLHTQPWQELWLEEADKLGLLIVEEGALWCDGGGAYAYGDPRFWTNAKEHLAGMVRRDRNHASVIMWSLENELLHCGAERYDKDVEKKLGELGRSVKALDPEHLITFEADHDPGGAADVIGLHYPHEVPAFSDYPNTADWLSSSARTGTEGGLMGSRDKEFHWDRKKPLYIGEYLWCPDQDYAVASVFFGPDAYRDREGYHKKAQALSWKDQTLAYRRAGVTGLCPWTAFDFGGKPGAPVLSDAASEVQVPAAVYLRQKDTRFFASDKVARTLEVYNDVPVAQDLVLTWQLEGDGKQGRQELHLDPAEYRAVTVELALPAATKAAELGFSYELTRGAQKLHGGKASLHVEPKAKLAAPRGPKLVVLDPAGTWSKTAVSEGLRHRTIAALSELAPGDAARTLLVVAPNALDIGAAAGGGGEALPIVGPSTGALATYLLAGGRALVLEQTRPREMLGLELVQHASTMAFLVDAAHPVLAGLDADAFKFWRGDHYVSRAELRRPQRGGGRALVVSGGAAELDQGPVIELPYGAGRALWLQALVGEKFTSEPAARRLLQNSLDYLARPPASTVATVISDEPELSPALVALGVDHEERPAPAGSALVVLGGGGAKVQAALPALKAAIAARRGPKILYWHAPTAQAFEQVRDAFGASALTVVSGAGPLTSTGTPSGAFAGVCAEDLLWKGAPHGESWTRGFEPDINVVSQVLSPAAPSGGFERLALGNLQGTYVSQNSEGITFATVGTASAPIEVKRAGLRYLRLTASGTSLGGVLPVARLSVAGGPSATVQLTKKERSEYFALLDLASGKGTLSVEFVNDAASGGEDRNLVVHEVALSSEPWTGGGAKLFTLPAAIAELTPPGGTTRVLVDFVRWPGESKNALRAGRYASALFAGLGARFKAPEVGPSWLPTAGFRLTGPSPYSEVTSKEITLRSAGTAVQAFTVTAQGKYVPVLRARSDPAKNVYAIVELAIDGKPAGSIEIKSSQAKPFELSALELAPGRHEIALTFTNDLYENGADRNLFVEAVGFRQ